MALSQPIGKQSNMFSLLMTLILPISLSGSLPYKKHAAALQIVGFSAAINLYVNIFIPHFLMQRHNRQCSNLKASTGLWYWDRDKRSLYQIADPKGWRAYFCSYCPVNSARLHSYFGNSCQAEDTKALKLFSKLRNEPPQS